MTDLKNRAMLCTLSVSLWYGRKHDKKGDKAVADVHGVDQNAGRFNKVLVDPKADAFKAVRAAASKIKNEWLRVTMPWLSDGTRILPTKLYTEFAISMESLMQEFRSAVRAFATVYPVLRDEARTALNGLFRDTDYPLDITSKFDVSLGYFPMPDGDDFRCDLSDDQLATLQQSAATATHDAMARSVRDVWDRLRKCTERIAKTLAAKDKTFRDTLTGNLTELLDLLPSLNITDDPDLARMSEEVRKKLLHEPDSMRQNKSFRADVAADAQRITDEMGAFMAR